MRYYGYEGETSQTIVETTKHFIPPDLVVYDENQQEVSRKPAILMQYERPSNKHIANIDGTWQIPTEQ